MEQAGSRGGSRHFRASPEKRKLGKIQTTILGSITPAVTARCARKIQANAEAFEVNEFKLDCPDRIARRSTPITNSQQAIPAHGVLHFTRHKSGWSGWVDAVPEPMIAARLIGVASVARPRLC